MTRYAKPGDVGRSRFANRPATSREQLALLGAKGDVDPDKLLFLKDVARDDWTLGTGVTTEAATAQGTTEMASDVVVLDAQNEFTKAVFTCNPGIVPVGAYVLRVRAKDSAQVANDFGIKVRNATDAADRLAQVTRTLTGSYAVYEVLFALVASDAGDSIELTFTKATAGANTIRVDYVSLHPLSSRAAGPWGVVPDGGRIEFAYNGSGDVTSHTVYDALASGNTIETATYSYTGGDLTSIAYTRDGQTMTETLTYTNGDVTKVERSVA